MHLNSAVLCNSPLASASGLQHNHTNGLTPTCKSVPLCSSTCNSHYPALPSRHPRHSSGRCRAAFAEDSSSSDSAGNSGNGVPEAALRAIQETSTENGSILQDDFCIIEGRDSVKDFAALQLAEVMAGIQSRRTKIFLLMEEVRRLRIQERIKGGGKSKEAELASEPYRAAVPLLPARTDASMKEYWRFYLTSVSVIILFGGLLSPVLEFKMGLGGTTYADFIRNMHLPSQLAAVDPIVASFCGGAVGVLTTLLLVELYNSDIQAKNRCIYCGGTGYVTCGSCTGAGTAAPSESLDGSERCATCSGTGKVMCTGCLCTGKKVAQESDPRLDPFF